MASAYQPIRLSIPDPAMVLLVGVAGSGKSTFARRHFPRTAVLSSDGLRAAVSDDPTEQDATPQAFTLMRILGDMRLQRGRLCVCDATNLLARDRWRLLGLARKHDVPAVAVVFDLPFELCRAHDAARADRTVGEAVLARQHAQLQRALEELPHEPFQTIHVLRGPAEMNTTGVALISAGSAGTPSFRRRPAVLVDLDGTLSSSHWRLSHIRGRRRDWRRFFELMGRDAPVRPLVGLISALAADLDVVIVSGRPADYEPTVRRWLETHGIPYDGLILRRSGDQRPDELVKRELYHGRIEPHWDVLLAIDDRDSAVQAWRELGVYVLRATDPQLPPLERPL